jgi:hypothetical protein
LTSGKTKRRCHFAETPLLSAHRIVTWTFLGPVNGEVHCSSVEWSSDVPKPRKRSPKLLQDYRDGCLPEFVGRPEARGANRHRFFMLRPLYGPLGLVLKPSARMYETGVRALKRIAARIVGLMVPSAQ